MSLNQQIEEWLQSRRLTASTDSRPHVTLCYAQSLDGSLTTSQGVCLPLSGAESTRLTHQLRSLHDAILIGIGTVLSDNPQLTVRDWSGPNPQPVILDRHFRTPAEARICHHPDKRSWIFTSNRQAEIGDRQIEVIWGDTPDGAYWPLTNVLTTLSNRGINSVMVEGGAGVITAFLRERLADAVVLTMVPRLLGGYHAIDDMGLGAGTGNPVIDPVHFDRLGDDLIVWGHLLYPETST